MCNVHSARAVHVHHASHHQMQCTIELRTLNFISVPNLVSLAQNFLESENTSRINFFRSWRVHLASHENGNQKTVQLRAVYV